MDKNTNYLDLINHYIQNTSVTKPETKRLNSELELIYRKLSKNQYKVHDFSKKNQFNIPERTQEFFAYLDSYCLTGRTIAKILMKLDINRYDSVVDLCSGWAPKVTLALYYAHYKKEVVLIDKKKEYMDQLEKFMPLFYIKYKISKRPVDVFSKSKNNYPFIIANHIIDDLIIEFYCRKHNIDTSSVYESEQKLIEIWNQILKAKKTLTPEILEMFLQIFADITTKNGILIISQYQSLIEDLLNLSDVTKYCKEVMNKLKDLLTLHGFSHMKDIPLVLENFQGAFNEKECFVLKKDY